MFVGECDIGVLLPELAIGQAVSLPVLHCTGYNEWVKG